MSGYKEAIWKRVQYGGCVIGYVLSNKEKSLLRKGYRPRKWTRQVGFESWTRLFEFRIILIPLSKLWIDPFFLQWWANSRTDWALSGCNCNQSKRKKTEFKPVLEGWAQPGYSARNTLWIAPLQPKQVTGPERELKFTSRGKSRCRSSQSPGPQSQSKRVQTPVVQLRSLSE